MSLDVIAVRCGGCHRNTACINKHQLKDIRTILRSPTTQTINHLRKDIIRLTGYPVICSCGATTSIQHPAWLTDSPGNVDMLDAMKVMDIIDLRPLFAKDIQISGVWYDEYIRNPWSEIVDAERAKQLVDLVGPELCATVAALQTAKQLIAK